MLNVLTRRNNAHDSYSYYYVACGAARGANFSDDDMHMMQLTFIIITHHLHHSPRRADYCVRLKPPPVKRGCGGCTGIDCVDDTRSRICSRRFCS